jgi:hypothetical protein
MKSLVQSLRSTRGNAAGNEDFSPAGVPED